MKKIIKRVSIFISISVLLFLLIYFYVMVKQYHGNNVIDGYTNLSKCYDETLRDWYDYHIYSYNETFDDKFINNKNYGIINDDNIDEVKSFFDKMKVIIGNGKCEYIYSKFDKDIISLGDYVAIIRPEKYYTELEQGCEETNKCYHKNHFRVYFYDIDCHTLYMIENNP